MVGLGVIFTALLALAQTPEEGSVYGVVAESHTGVPIPKTQVFLYGRQRERRNDRVTSTGAGGAFHFAAVKPGTYSLRASKELYAEDTRTQTIVVSPGEAVRDVRIALDRTAVITGRVLNDEGEPVIRARVEVMQYRGNKADRTLQAMHSERTNDQGEYRIWGIGPGGYYCAAYKTESESRLVHEPEAANQPEPLYPRVYFPGTSNQTEAQRIKLQPGKLLNVDFRLAAVRAVSVSGRVNIVADADSPVLGSLIFERDGPNQGGATRGINQPEFVFKNVMPGEYVLDFVSNDRPQRQYARQRITVAGENIEGIVLQPRPPMSLSGIVRVDGELPPGQRRRRRLFVSPQNGFLRSPHLFDGIEIDNDGKFTIADLPPDRYQIEVNGYDPGYVKAIRAGNVELLKNTLDLELIEPGELSILVATDFGTLDVTVSGKPPENATAVLVPDRIDGGWHQNGARFEAVPPGEYSLFVFERDPGQLLEDLESCDTCRGKSVHVEIKPKGKHVVEAAVIPIDGPE